MFQKRQIAVLKKLEVAQVNKKRCSCPLRTCWNLNRNTPTQRSGQPTNTWREHCRFLPNAGLGLLLPSLDLGSRERSGEDCSRMAPVATETGSRYRWSPAVLDCPGTAHTPPQHAPKIHLSWVMFSSPSTPNSQTPLGRDLIEVTRIVLQ